MSVVADSSVTTGWLLRDEQDPLSLAALSRVQSDRAVVPRHWLFEVANSLLVAERRGRLETGEVTLLLGQLDSLSIQIDEACDIDRALELAQEHELTVYDAVYLELAMRQELPLATLDGDLDHAAATAGVDVFSV